MAKKINTKDLATAVSLDGAYAEVTELAKNEYRVDWYITPSSLVGYLHFKLDGDNCHVETLATQPKQGTTTGIYSHLCYVWTHWLLDHGYKSITAQAHIDQPGHAIFTSTGFEVHEEHSEDFHTLKADISKKDNPLYKYGEKKAKS